MKTMNISAELLDDYRKMSTAVPRKKMKILSEESALYSIGDDGNLYLLYKNVKDGIGWENRNISESPAKLFGFGSVQVITFDVRKYSEAYGVLFAAECDGAVRIFSGIGTDPGTFVWSELTPEKNLMEESQVTQLYLSVTGAEEMMVCDLKSQDRVSRWTIELKNGTVQWKRLELPADFAMTETSLPGRAEKSKVSGIYTLGNLAGEKQLLYTPLYNRFNREIPPLPIRFSMEKQADDIAVFQEGEDKGTHLFACGDGGLYLYPSEIQADLCKPVLLLESDQFQNVTCLSAYRAQGEMVISGIGKAGNLFFCRTEAENWKEPSAWSEVQTEGCRMQYVECSWDGNAETEYAFGVSGDGKCLLKMERSKETGIWNTGAVHIPDLKQKADKIPSFVTEVHITDDEPAYSEQSLLVSAANPCQVYINGIYYELGLKPKEVPCDETGTMRIVEEAAGLYGTELMFEIEGIRNSICPSKDPMQRLFQLNTADKLKKAKVDGVPLADEGCTEAQLEAVAGALRLIGESGSVDKLWEGNTLFTREAVGERRSLSGIKPEEVSGNQALLQLSFCGGSLTGIAKSGQGTYKTMCLEGVGVYAIDMSVTDMEDTLDVIYTSASRFFDILYSLGSKIVNVCISCVKDVWQFTVQVGKTIYAFVMDTAEKLIAGISKIFESIKTGVEKLIRYLRYIFAWDDIKRTAEALEKSVLNGFDMMESQIGETQGKLHEAAELLTSLLDKWAEIEHSDVTGESLEKRSGKEVSLDVRQNYLMDYGKENITQCDIKNSKAGDLPDEEFNELKQLVDNIIGFADTEGVIIGSFLDRARSELMDSEKLKNMNFGDICRKLLVLITDTAVYTMENILFSVLELVKIMIRWLKKILSAPVHIPILSDILEDVFGISEKSVLQISCLVISAAAVPALKICGGGNLIREEVLQYIEQTPADRVRRLQASSDGELPVSKVAADAFGALHIICGIVNVFETLVTVKTQMQKPKVGGEDTPASGIDVFEVAAGVLGVVDGCAYITASFIYQPCDLKKDNWIYIYKSIFTSVKYAGLIGKLGNKFADSFTFLKVLGSDRVKTVCEMCNLTGALVLVTANIFYMSMGTDGRNKKEKELLYLDCSSLIADNLRIALDNVIPYADSQPLVKAVLVGTRVFFSVSYSGLQIAVGSDAVS